MSDTGEITRLLSKWADEGDEGLDELLPLVLDDLRSLAAHHLSKHPGTPTFQPTALVNEAYLRFKTSKIEGFENRNQFFAFASRVLRGVLVDYARARQTGKRGGEGIRVELDESLTSRSELHLDTLLTLDQALTKLDSSHPRQSRVLELHLFGGLTLPEISSALGRSQSTVERDWTLGRRRLARELR